MCLRVSPRACERQPAIPRLRAATTHKQEENNNMGQEQTTSGGGTRDTIQRRSGVELEEGGEIDRLVPREQEVYDRLREEDKALTAAEVSNLLNKQLRPGDRAWQPHMVTPRLWGLVNKGLIREVGVIQKPNRRGRKIKLKLWRVK